jgi:HSP20 family protein
MNAYQKPNRGWADPPGKRFERLEGQFLPTGLLEYGTSPRTKNLYSNPRPASEVFKVIGHGTAAGGSYPPVNIFQQGDSFIAVLEAPGVSKDDLAIEAKENTIRVSGRKAIDYGEGVSVHRRERLSGVFDRSIVFPVDINTDAVRAEYHDGVLALFVPRAEHEKPRTIKIR